MSKIGMPMSKSKDILPNPINIILILRSKVKVIELINVRDTSYHGDNSRTQQSMTMSKDKKAEA